MNRIFCILGTMLVGALFFLHLMLIHNLALYVWTNTDNVSDVFLIIVFGILLAAFVMLVKRTVGRSRPYVRAIWCPLAILIVACLAVWSRDFQVSAAHQLFFWVNEETFKNVVQQKPRGSSAVLVHRISGNRSGTYFVYVESHSLPVGSLSLEDIDALQDAIELRGCRVHANPLKDKFYVIIGQC